MRPRAPPLPATMPHWRVWHGPPGAMVQIAVIPARSWSDAHDEALVIAREKGLSGRITVTLATEYDPV